MLQTTHYNSLVLEFREWLDILGYAATTVYNLPNHLTEFLYWIELHGYTDLKKVNTAMIDQYYHELQHRINERRSGGLSKSYLNKHQQALKKFAKYLLYHQDYRFNIPLQYERNPCDEKVNILTQSEIKLLFTVCDHSHEKLHFRHRDKVILVLFYSCGLRRNEAIHLDLKDVLFNEERIYVRKGKNYKERFVPINSYNLEILSNYMYDDRLEFQRSSKTEALLLSQHGKRINGQSISNRLKAIIATSENRIIKDKEITLHTLRHSIATHLLEQDVPLENIKTFLGHSSLESTQLYTHLLKSLQDELY